MTAHMPFKVTTYDELDDGAIFMAVIQEETVVRCIKAFGVGEHQKNPMFVALHPDRPTLHSPDILGPEVIDVSAECRIVPDAASLMVRMPELSQAHGTMAVTKDKKSQDTRVFLGAHYKKAGDGALYVDIA